MKHKFYLSLVALLVACINASAQTYTHSREVAKGTVNMTELAEYEKKHPPRYKQKPVIEEEEEAGEAIEIPESDPSIVRMKRPNTLRAAAASTGTAYMPISTTPTDSFLAWTSNGTSIPPDTHGAVDSLYVVNANNARIKIQTRTGAAATPALDVSADGFWGSSIVGGSGYSSFDPRVHYDKYAKRWMIIAVSTNGGFTGSRILIAVSATGNPTGTWYKFGVNVYSSTSGWVDFPNVGWNNKWIVVTGNYFTAGGSFTTAAVWCFDKAALYANTGAPNTRILVSGAFTLAPAQTYDPTKSNMFLVNIGNRGATSGGQLQLRKISGGVSTPTISSVYASPSAGSLPSGVRRWAQNGAGGADFAPQLGSTFKVQTNDDRITNLVYRNGKLWCAHTVFFPISSPTRSSVMWWSIDTAGTPDQVGLIDDPTGARFYAFPSIAVNALDDALVGFSTFASSIYPSAAYALHLHTDPEDSMRLPFIYRYGKKPYYRTFGGSQNRFGDYSGTCVDPRNDNDFWTVQEAVPNYSGSISASLWDTWWARVQICPTPPTPTLAVSTALHCIGTSQTYGVTPITGATGYTWSITPTTSGWSLTPSTTSSTTITAGTGTATVTVTASNSCGPGSALVFTITGGTAPAAPTVATVTPACVGSTTASFTATATGATSFSWSASGPGWSGTSSTSSFSPTVGTAAGSISVFASNACGVSSINTFAVPLATVPDAATAITAPTSPCSGTSATFTTPAVTGATSYTWTVTGTGWSGTSTTETLNATVGTGDATITVTPVNACGNGTPFTLTPVTPAITPASTFSISVFTVTPSTPVTVTYTGAASSAAIYTWNFGGGTATPGTGAGPHSVTWTTLGTKTVTLTVADNGCTSAGSSDTVRVRTITNTPGLNNPAFSATIVPNPSNGTFNIMFDRTISGNVSITLFDVQGRKVYSNVISAAGSNILPVHTTNLAPGNYAATIATDGGKVNAKITIEK